MAKKPTSTNKPTIPVAAEKSDTTRVENCAPVVPTERVEVKPAAKVSPKARPSVEEKPATLESESIPVTPQPPTSVAAASAAKTQTRTTRSSAAAPKTENPMAEGIGKTVPEKLSAPMLRGKDANQPSINAKHAVKKLPRPKEVLERPSQPDTAPAQPQSVHVEELLPVETPASDEELAHQPQHRPNLFIVHISPEMAPVAKVGGLADVVFGLSQELAIRGNHVEIILPKYDNMRYDHIYNLHVDFQDLLVPWFEGTIHCTVYFGLVHDRKCFFIEPHSQDDYFNRGSIYGFQDDVMRFAFFSRAAMEFLWRANKQPDIIHCHDWQTALVPVYLYEFYQRMGMTHPRVCLTIHNYQHQGVTGGELLRATGLHDPQRYFDYNRLRDNYHQQALNLLKGGIVYSNFVTTVSPRYAFETKDGGQGFGLEPTLHTHHIKYGGVVNGIDYGVWNPEVDGYIPTRYGVDSIDGKYDNKRALRDRLMLAHNDKPIVAFIGRLDPQKGLDLLRHAIFFALERGAQFVLLGSSPDQAINADFWGLKQMLNDSQDCHLEIGFNEELSHLIYAGADMMLVPSRFEPCGLTQLISLRYGTIPVVRSVGGLADTVFDQDDSDLPLHERNGYVFESYDHPGLEYALGRAIACYSDHPDRYRELIKNAMRYDYSWNHPGEDYLNIYDFIREK